jgi:EpsD family peptidyl-prolyl cis-trans isomerase
MHTAHFVKPPAVIFCTLALTLLALTACGKKEVAINAAPSQVAAKVGSEEISIYQINQVLSRANTRGVSPEVIQVMSRDALEKLIDQQLAIEQATVAKLHRMPEVVAEIENARREILARAYIQQLTNALPQPTEQEAKQYFDLHPQLFAERKVFNVQELVTPANPAVADQLRAFASTGKPVEEVAAWLKEKEIKFTAANATRGSEQIPLDLLPKVYGLKDGQSTVWDIPQGITFVRVIASQPAPVTQPVAIPRIQQFLANQRASEAITANIALLRANTKISYVGEFATPLSAAPVDTSNKSALEKGVAGLK